MDDAELHRLTEEARAASQQTSGALCLMPTLADVLAMLPGVRADLAARRIRQLDAQICELIVEATLTLRHLPTTSNLTPFVEPAPGVVLVPAAFGHLIATDGRVTRSTPQGAAILLRLYRAAWMPMRRGAIPGPAPKAEAYAASGPALAARAAEERAQATAWRQEPPVIIDPATVPESEFSEAVLERVFTSNLGAYLGSCGMAVGGVEVSRHCQPNRSNSGRIKHYDISFSWTGSDGVRREVPDPSDRMLSRQHDPDRNWGMRRRE